jgi:hypothetical protein
VKLTIVSLTTCLIANSVWAEPVLLPVKALHCEDYEVVRDTMVDYGELPPNDRAQAHRVGILKGAQVYSNIQCYSLRIKHQELGLCYNCMIKQRQHVLLLQELVGSLI